MQLSPDQMFLIYNPQTGAGIYTIESPYGEGTYETLVGSGQPFVVAPKGIVTDYYVEDGQAKLRPSMSITWADGKNTILANATDTCTIEGVPAGATVRVDGEPAFLNTFGADTPGTYRVEVECWPHLPWTGTFTAE